MITFHIITTFPEMFDSYLGESILKRAIKNKKIAVKFYNPRDFAGDRHKKTDFKPYGGGPGMVMKAEPILKAVAKARGRKQKVKIILFSPNAKQFDTRYAEKLSKGYKDIILIAGRYEGIDARVKRALKSGARNSKSEISVEEVSVGPYTLTGGELPAMIVVDAVSRRIKGVLGKDESIEEKRIASKDVYTRPEVLEHKGKKYRVPKVLLSGHHKNIDSWREKKKS